MSQLSKVHTCHFQEMVASGKAEPKNKKKCKCKRVVSFEQAQLMVKWGEAKWVVVERNRVEVEKECRLCLNGDTKSTCDVCKGAGKMKVILQNDRYNFDIVLGKHQGKSNRISTPRTPTIESKHILRAYVSNASRELVSAAQNMPGEWEENEYLVSHDDKEFIRFQPFEPATPQQAKAAANRINEYGKMTQEECMFMHQCTHRPNQKCGRPVCTAGKRVSTIKLEPEDNREKGEGRSFDYGRALLYTPNS